MDIFPTQHAPFGVEPVGSQQEVGEPCAREVVAGDTPACRGVQDPAVPGGESHSTGVPQHRSPSTPCQTLVLLQDLSNARNMQGGKGLLLGSPPCTPPPPQWVRVLLLGPTFCREVHSVRPSPSEELAPGWEQFWPPATRSCHPPCCDISLAVS